MSFDQHLNHLNIYLYKYRLCFGGFEEFIDFYE